MSMLMKMFLIKVATSALIASAEFLAKQTETDIDNKIVEDLKKLVEQGRPL